MVVDWDGVSTRVDRQPIVLVSVNRANPMFDCHCKCTAQRLV